MVLSIFARTWATRRLIRQIGRRLELLELTLVTSRHLAWNVAAFRPPTG